ncbi:Protein disulfide-isomerase tmx3 [Cichlidogyrus casuarinus]|uniref:Protein disulfide-isomerase tmx3 n=1 Tax=Cichlidogyrus casuarinus TaxID=1844966 RepID=A0ABD2QBB6_9PLAT
MDAVFFMHIGTRTELYVCSNLNTNILHFTLLQNIYEKTAESLIDVSLFYHFEASEKEMLHVMSILKCNSHASFPLLLVYKDGNSIQFEGTIDQEVVANWIKREKTLAFPKVSEFSVWSLAGEELESVDPAPKHKMVCVFLLSKLRNPGSSSLRFWEMGQRLVTERSSNLTKYYQFAWADEIAGFGTLSMNYFGLETPNLVIIEPKSGQLFLHPDYQLKTGLSQVSHRSVVTFLEQVAQGRVNGFLVKGLFARLKRVGLAISSSYYKFFVASPIICCTVSAIPIILISLIFYICCMSNIAEDVPSVALPAEESKKKIKGTTFGPVMSDTQVAIRRAKYHADLKKE